jgi:hypothetical protein
LIDADELPHRAELLTEGGERLQCVDESKGIDSLKGSERLLFMTQPTFSERPAKIKHGQNAISPLSAPTDLQERQGTNAKNDRGPKRAEGILAGRSIIGVHMRFQPGRDVRLYFDDGKEILARPFYSSTAKGLFTSFHTPDGRPIQCIDEPNGVFEIADTRQRLSLSPPTE